MELHIIMHARLQVHLERSFRREDRWERRPEDRVLRVQVVAAGAGGPIHRPSVHGYACSYEFLCGRPCHHKEAVHVECTYRPSSVLV